MTAEDLDRLYKEHYGNSHIAGLVAVYEAGKADGSATAETAVAEEPAPAVEQSAAPSTEPEVANTATEGVQVSTEASVETPAEQPAAPVESASPAGADVSAAPAQ